MAMSAALGSVRIPIGRSSARWTIPSILRGTCTSAIAASISILREAKAGLASTSICGGRSLPAPSVSDPSAGMPPSMGDQMMTTSAPRRFKAALLAAARNGRLLRYEYSDRAEHCGATPRHLLKLHSQLTSGALRVGSVILQEGV